MDQQKDDMITEDDCYKILKSSSQKDAHLIRYSINKANDKTVGFLGDYFYLHLTFETEGEVKEAEYFLKTEPLFNENQRNFVQDCGLFKKEAFLYEKVIPELMKIAKEKFAPSCLLTKEELLVLEDLKFRKVNIVRRDYSLQECESLVKTLARFHCSSVIYEEKMKKLGHNFSFKQYIDKLPEGTFSFDECNAKYKWLKCVTACLIDLMKTLEVHDDNIETKLLDFIFGGELQKSIKPSEKFRNVLTHNDLWANNIFLGKNGSCILIDFQLVRYTPPVYDFIMAVFLNNSVEFIENHFESTSSLYYETFSKLLVDHHLVPDAILSAEEFYKSLEMYKLPALIEATMFATTVYLPEEKSAYIRSDSERYLNYTFASKTPYIMDDFNNNQIYRKKISGLVVALATMIRKTTIPKLQRITSSMQFPRL